MDWTKVFALSYRKILRGISRHFEGLKNLHFFFIRLHSYQDEQILLSLVLQFANIRLHLGCEVDRKRKLRSSAFREAREDWMFCSPLSLWEKRRPFPPSLHISPWQPVFHLRRDHVYLMTPIKLSHILSK